MAQSSLRFACGLMAVLAAFAEAAVGAPPAPQHRGNGRAPNNAGKLVFKMRIEPHWIGDGARFWYRNDLADGKREFVLVDAERGERRPAFDHARLAAALSKASGDSYQGDRLPFDTIEFIPPLPLVNGEALAFRAGGVEWSCGLENYQCRRRKHKPAEQAERPAAAPLRSERAGRQRFGRGAEREARSPDGAWTAFIKDHNVYVRAKGTTEETALSDDGKEGLAYGRLEWSPDSKALTAFRIEPGEDKEVYLVQSSPPGGGRAKLQARPYPLPGDKFTAFELNLFVFDGDKPRKIRPKLDRIDFGHPRFHWDRDGRHFAYEKVDRGHQRYRLVRVDSHTGEANDLIDEKSDTFIWTAHREAVEVPIVTWLDLTDELIYASERDGWRHLYLINSKTGAVKSRPTRGEHVVRGIDRIDEDQRQIWFHASGEKPGQDPYFVHYYRVDFDGSNLVALTDGNGNHRPPRFSPDRRFFIDAYSRVDQPPIHELRRSDDGKLVCRLEEADISALRAGGWRPPEVFKAKGRDGKTDIWGVVHWPKEVVSGEKLPVVESIYAGPQGSFVPKDFSPFRRFAALNDRGVAVAQIDGMGTANRSKAFHDVCWHNLKDAGFPDRILWHRAFAKTHPDYDIDRVGIFGTSAGGQNAAGGLLFHPEFYKVGAAACGCHDNRMDKASWNEQWMGFPVGPWYSESSNIDNAAKLRGKLLLIVGEMDSNVPPESTMRFVDALVRADKDFELLVVPNANHGMGGAYGARRMNEFLARELLSKGSPERSGKLAGPLAETGAPSLELASRNDDHPRGDRDRTTAATGPRPILKPDSKPESAGRAADVPLAGLNEHDEGRSELRGAIELYSSDRGNLFRSAPPSASPRRGERFRVFQTRWLDRLHSVDFDSLARDGKIDYLLFQNHLEHEIRKLDIQKRERSDWAALVPFADVILGLDEGRKRLDEMDWSKVADDLDRLARTIDEARRSLDGKPADNAHALQRVRTANQAVEAVDGLRNTLRSWFGFYNGYDPLFTWWAPEPYQRADRAIEAYAAALREKYGAAGPRGGRRRGGRGGEGGPAAGELQRDSAIVGTPIGRDALLSELKFEMIAYTPEELIDLARRELAWCEGEMKKASRAMGLGDDWRAALERVKARHVRPGEQPRLVRDLANEAIAYLDANNLVTVPPLCRESWRMTMLSPQAQLVNPFFLGGETIQVSFPTNTMPHDAKLMSMRGNNEHFARATVAHELVPGHHLQGFMADRYKPYRQLFRTPFLVEGWSLYWELLLWDRGYARSPEDRVGMLFWRMHRCARIIFSLSFHLEKMTPQECIDFLVERVGHERDNATAEVRRSFTGAYGPLYQAAYLLGGFQLHELHRDLVETGKLTDRAFHDAVLKENAVPIDMVRAALTHQKLSADYRPDWKFYRATVTKR